jgi:hypothetical protein
VISVIHFSGETVYTVLHPVGADIMTGRKNKAQPNWDEDEKQFTQNAQPKQGNAEDEELEDEDGDEDVDLASIADSETPHGKVEPDSREVDSITDRIFSSVLSRYGWERRGERIEHIGEERRNR